MNADHIDWQIIWKNSPKDVIEEYRPLKVTYTTTRAFLSTRKMKQLLFGEKETFRFTAEASSFLSKRLGEQNRHKGRRITTCKEFEQKDEGVILHKAENLLTSFTGIKSSKEGDDE